MSPGMDSTAQGMDLAYPPAERARDLVRAALAEFSQVRWISCPNQDMVRLVEAHIRGVLALLSLSLEGPYRGKTGKRDGYASEVGRLRDLAFAASAEFDKVQWPSHVPSVVVELERYGLNCVMGFLDAEAAHQ